MMNFNELASVDDGMNVIARMPYLVLLEFADLIRGDADKMADAARKYENDTYGEKNDDGQS